MGAGCPVTGTAPPNSVAGRIGTEKTPNPTTVRAKCIPGRSISRTRVGTVVCLLSLIQADSYRPRVDGCPHHSDANRSTRVYPDRRTTRAERADPSSDEDRCASRGVRPRDYVHLVRVFALCIWQAPRPAATFGSFWSLQKEPAGGREFGEMWMLSLVFDFRFCFKLTAER